MTSVHPQQSDERTITMHRCGRSGSVFTCGCTPRFTDLDAGPDYSCEDESEVRYVRLDPSVPVVHHAIMLAENERLRAALEDIRDGLEPHRERLSSQQAKNAYEIAADALTGNERRDG